MNPLLQTHFDTALEHPNGIKKLRELILTLAMQGKLVEQNPNDQPASVLLKEIQAEKARLVAEGKIKKSETLSSKMIEELPCNLPKNWEWVRLKDLGFFTGGKTPSTNNSKFWNGNIPWVSAKDMKSEFIRDSEDHITEAGLATGLMLIPENSILMVVRSGILRRTFPVGINKVECTINQDLKALILHRKDLGIYIMLMLKGFEGFILGKLSKTGMTVESLTVEEFMNQRFPLPPLAEQKRIVEKIGELFALCDELERLKQSKDTKRKDLHQSVISQMLEAETHSDFQRHFEFLTTHFHELYAVKENVKELRKAVLQLAVMGKLIPQDPKDQPASELLKEIQAEKARLVADGKIKKSEALPPVKEEEKPFAIPKGWEWVRLGECIEFTNGYTFKSNEFQSSGIGIVKIGDIANGKVTKEKMDYVDKSFLTNLDSKFQVKRDDLLIAMSGATTGKLGFNFSDEIFLLNQRVGKISTIKLNKKYLYNYLSTQIEKNLSISSGSAIPNLSTEQINSTPFPLPPLAEQKRIVEKVDQLLALCDMLEEGIGKAEEKRGEILEGMVRVS